MKKKHKIIDLFCGAGGFTLGAHYAGFHTALAIDIDKDITASFSNNFSKTSLLLKDVSCLSPTEIKDKTNSKTDLIDGIIGGPPCQGFSHIGRRNQNDERNSLVNHFFRIVAAIKPTFFVMENVPGILHGFGRHLLDSGIDLVYKQYEILGPSILNAVDFGAATIRRRVFVIGYRPEYMERLTEDDIYAPKITTPVSVRDAINDLPKLCKGHNNDPGEYFAFYPKNKDLRLISTYARNAREAPPTHSVSKTINDNYAKGMVSGYKTTIHTRDVIERFSRVLPGKTDAVSKCPRLSWDIPCNTLRAGTGKDRGGYQSIRPIHPEENRVISVREAARIQGLPDWFQFHPTIWHSFRMIGNSVSPYMGFHLLDLIRKRL